MNEISLHSRTIRLPPGRAGGAVPPLELKLLDEICSRLKIAGELNEVAVQDIRALRSHGIDLGEIEKAIQQTANISRKELDKLLDEVVERNQRYYREVIDLAGVTALRRW